MDVGAVFKGPGREIADDNRAHPRRSRDVEDRRLRGSLDEGDASALTNHEEIAVNVGFLCQYVLEANAAVGSAQPTVNKAVVFAKDLEHTVAWHATSGVIFD